MKFIINAIKTLIIITGAMFLTAFTINATDNLGNFSESALGGMVGGIFGEEPRCPEGMTLIDDADGGFCIDMYEASPSEDCLYRDPANQSESMNNINAPKCIPVSVEGGRPWRNISQTQAVSACIKAGKRLPTNQEWYTASIGTPDQIDSWGSDSCNVASNWLTGSPGETGSAASCMSYYGVYDMIGNVWEWVSDTVRNGEYNGITIPNTGYVASVDESGVAITTGTTSDPMYNNDKLWSGNSDQVVGIFRGGYWGSREEGGVYSIFAQMPPSFVGVGVGFRCVK